MDDMTQPIRVQRKRTKGFKLPENTVCVTRGTKWGNPFKVIDGFIVFPTNKTSYFPLYRIKNEDNANSILATWYDMLINGERKFDGIILPEWIVFSPINKKDIKELKGKNLACFCKITDVCHADILLILANEPKPN